MPTALDQWPIIGRDDDLDAFRRGLADPACAGFLVHGAAGVGKTRLAEECRGIAERDGFTTATAVASRTAAQLPLGALAHLIPRALASGESFDPVRLFDHVRDDLQERLDGKRLLLSVDDVHLLDVASATLVSQMLASGLAFLLGTIRDGEPVPDAVSALWRNGQVVRVDLAELGAGDVETVLRMALDGPVASGVADRLWKASRGNALFLRELVLEALGTGALALVDGTWHCDELPTGSRRLVEVVADRIGVLGDEARAVLDLLALCQPLGLADLEATAPESILEELEAAGLIQVQVDRRRHQVTLAHPLYAEALRAALPVLRSRRILRAHISRIEDHGARRLADPLRIATWRLDADGQADPALLVRAAMIARHANDFRQTERLASAAYRTDPTTRAGLLLGEALYELGSFDEAGKVLDAIDTPDLDDDDLILQVTIMRCKNLHWGRLDPEAALAVNLAARPRVTEGARAELLADEASIRVFSGDPRGSLELLDGLGDLDDPRVRVLRAIPEAPALSFIGRTTDAVAVAERGFAEHLALPEPLAIAHPGSHVVAQVFALTDAGRLDEAEVLGRAGHEVAAAERVPIAQIWFAYDLGRIELLRGHPVTARGWYQEGAALCRAHHFGGPLAMGLPGVMTTSAIIGDLLGAAAARSEYEALPEFAFLLHEQQAGRAWAAQAAGDPAEARAILLEAADGAEATGHRTSAAWCLHDAVRLGAIGLAPRLAHLASECDSALISARAAHAAALESGEAAALAACVDTWVGLGIFIEAVEAAVAGAEAHRRAGDQRAAAALDRRADELAAGCEGARTPGMARSASVVPLSRREREVALLAAQGIASKEISDRLYLSVRTVNNHLQRAYTKLGVASRAELAEALGV